MSWQVVHARGDAAEFHAAAPSTVRTATFHTVDRPALVLGSSQRIDEVDARVATVLGVEVVIRRSGGGAVLLLPGEHLWLDLVIPAGDPLWHDDVGAAMVWVGELWRDALADLDIDGTVHRGPLQPSLWSRQVCFAGLGTGEVTATATGGKLVGVAQRRTRTAARFQSMCHLTWRPELVAALVAPPRPTALELAHVAAPIAASTEDLIAFLTRRLPS